MPDPPQNLSKIGSILAHRKSSQFTTKLTSIAFDIEHTGFAKDGGSEEIIQIGIKKENGKEFERYFLPRQESTPEAQKAHGHTIESLKKLGAKPFTEQDANDIAEFMPGRRYPAERVEHETNAIAHNYNHDREILQKTFTRFKVWLPIWTRTCSQELAKKFGCDDETFVAFCDRFKVINSKKHDAMSDARALMECWIRMKTSGTTVDAFLSS